MNLVNEHILPVPLPFVKSRFHCTQFYLFIFQKVAGGLAPSPSPCEGPVIGVRKLSESSSS